MIKNKRVALIAGLAAGLVSTAALAENAYEGYAINGQGQPW